jgi:hypothetical protein
MKTKAIEFNAGDLVGSVEAFARHVSGQEKVILRTATRPLLRRSNHSHPHKCDPSAGSSM